MSVCFLDKSKIIDTCQKLSRKGGVDGFKNKKNNIIISYKNENDTLANWCRKLNLNYSKVRQRMYHGKTFEESIIGAEL